jgi:CRP/FNR family cyclic AMP-dependent transcriptional regulator
MKPGGNSRSNPTTVLAGVDGKTRVEFHKGQVIFSQGDPANAVFYVQRGKIALKVLSQQGKEAVVAIFERGNFFGEGCLAGQPLRMATAIASSECSTIRIEKQVMIRALHNEQAFSELFITYLLERNIRVEEDLIDHLFNSSEKRLARLLLLLAHFGKEDEQEEVIPKVSQETLAEMIGTTRSRVSFFMNRFRKLGFIHYNGGLKVHSSLLSIALKE